MAVADLTRQSRAGVSPAQAVHTIPVLALGMSASLFFVISYLICVLGYLLFPALPIEHAALAIFLPGFELLSWGTFFLGLVELCLWLVHRRHFRAPLQFFCAALALIAA